MSVSIDVSQDRENRRRIRTALQESLLVEAAAGTDKTTQLVARLVAVLREGLTTPEKVVAVTFTRKAAGELKLRLRQQLENERFDTEEPQQRSHLERAISRLEEARIGTIHSFCAELLRERPVEAGVDPDFAELSEDEAPRLFDRAFQGWIERRLNETSPTLSRVLSRLATWKSYPPVSPLSRLRDAAWQLAEWRDFPRPWRRDPFDRDAAIDRLVEEVDRVARASQLCDYKQDYLRIALRPARFFRRALEKSEELRGRDYDDLEAGLLELLRGLRSDKRKGRGRFSPTVSRQQMLEWREALLERLEEFKTRADADLAAGLRDEFGELLEGYEELKKRRGALDFVDLLVRARDLLRNVREVRSYFQGRFSHLFVDEFQDTDPLQAEILLLLAADDPDQSDWTKIRLTTGKLFVVGDPKQSIYRFRRADVLLYQQVKAVLQRAGARLLYLSRNFRSIRPLQEAVNSAFEPIMREDRESGQPGYVGLLEHLGPVEGQPEAVVLPVPAPYGYYNVSRYSVERGQPAIVGAFLQWLLEESGWKVHDPEEPRSLVPLLPQHVCILFRRFLSWNRDVTRPYIEQLESRGLPHVLVGSRTFHQREEVEALRAALTAVEWPDDELAVFATLKGSLFAVGDGALFRFRREIGRLHPFQKLPPDLDGELQPVAQGLQLLARLHGERNSQPIVQIVQELMEYTRAHAGFAFRPAGEQVLSNLQKVCDMARNYELSSGISFRGFVRRLVEEADKPRSGEAPVIEAGAEGIRVMTLHSAKGLEFPVVVLADITANLYSREPDKHVDLEGELCATRLLGCSPWELVENAEREQRRDEAEGVRIAYVAATRARDLLVVPAVGDGPLEGWVGPLTPALYPPKERWRSSQPAPGCPEFGQASVLERPSRYDGLAEFSVEPGMHHPQAGSHRVVWWDPALLGEAPRREFGLRQDRLLQEDGGSEASRESLDRYTSWKKGRAEAVSLGTVPEFQLEAVVEDDPELPEPAPGGLRVEYLQRPAGRPGGDRFGDLVHRVLRDVTLEPDPREVEEVTRFHARNTHPDESHVEAAVATVLGVLAHPLLERARQAQACHREWPFALPRGDGRLVEGVIDLAFCEPDGWTVLEFKTDEHLELFRDRYFRQLAWYVKAVEAIEGAPARGILLAV